MPSASSLRASSGFQHLFSSLTYISVCVMQGWPRLSALNYMLAVQLGPCYARVFDCRCEAMAHFPSYGAAGCSWGVVYKPAGYPLRVQNGDYKNKSLFQLFSAVLGSRYLETSSPRQQLCQPVAPVLCSHLASSSRRKCQNSEANHCLLVCLRANLQLMCNMMYLTALVWFCFLPHK